MSEQDPRFPRYLGKVLTDDLITELERRAQEGPGRWTGWQRQRLKILAENLNPPPLNP